MVIGELKKEIEKGKSRILLHNEKVKKIEFKNELMERIALKNERIHNEVIRMKQEIEISNQEKVNYLTDIEKKNEVLKQYKVRVSTRFCKSLKMTWNAKPSTYNYIVTLLKVECLISGQISDVNEKFDDILYCNVDEHVKVSRIFNSCWHNHKISYLYTMTA